MQATRSAPIPKSLRELFWDCRFASLRWDKHRDFIVTRVLAEGTWQQVRWLRSRLNDNELKEWLIGRRGRGLSRQQLRFWQLVLGLPHRQVTGWLACRQGIWEQTVRR